VFASLSGMDAGRTRCISGIHYDQLTLS